MIATFWNESWTAALVNHLWQSTLVVCVAWLLAWALRQNHARVRYWIWFAASIKFLLPFSLLIAAGEWIRSLLARPIVDKPQVAAALQQIAQPFAQAQFFEAEESPVATHRAEWLPIALLAIWACGALIVLARFGRGWWLALQAKRAARPLGLAAAVPVLSSPSPVEPGIFGIFRPVLLLPHGILERLTAEQMQAIVAHEMCHVRRRDNLTYAIHMVVESLFWFHPLAWWLGARLVEERERACDEAVLHATGQPFTYAEGILNICKFYVEAPLRCVSGVTGSELKQRIARILSGRRVRKLDLRRRALLALACVLAVGVPVVAGLVRAAHGQTQGADAAEKGGIAGTWQGTLHVGRDLRTVVKITKAEGGAYKAVFYSIDRGARPFPADSCTLDGSTVKMTLKVMGGTFEGKLSSDGKTIDGNWSQGPNPMPLVLTRATPETEWTIPPPPPPVKPMAADADPSFEVATIKPNNSGARSIQALLTHGRNFITRASSLEDLIAFAYSVQSKQIVGGPGWIDSDRYDIDALPDAQGEPNTEQLRVMIRKLLADRFQLKFHHEQREMSAYVLTVAKSGEKLRPTQLTGNLPGLGFRPGDGGLTLIARNATPSDLTGFLQVLVLDRPVVDRTGLKGHYDFDCTFSPDDSQFGGHPPMPPKSATGSTTDAAANTAPSLYEAFEQQLGLKLSAEKTAVDVIVIDHVDHPSPN